MSLYINFEKLLYLDFMIAHKCTGNAKEVAEKLGVARSTFFEYKRMLIVEFGAEVQFMPSLNTYIYIELPKAKSLLRFSDDKP